MTYPTEKLNKQYCVCSNHFEDSQFMNISTKNKLIHTAVPTLMNMPNPPAKLTPSRPLPNHQIVQTPSTSQIKLILPLIFYMCACKTIFECSRY